MADSKITKDRMLNGGFSPTQGNAEDRSANALEYIALYMEQIDSKLELLTGIPSEKGETSLLPHTEIGKITMRLTDIANSLKVIANKIG